eukprot:TRINITY_DN14438_c0_g2_i2.p1 TRINITY_DN14438_c0_g2~~TRINITY_DN14438_c0_g2_i2.p1  ORF type:complete len:1284 (+),score=490.06 TRINITY_DN14438_c0_g2_i2:116-3967(+)
MATGFLSKSDVEALRATKWEAQKGSVQFKDDGLRAGGKLADAEQQPLKPDDETRVDLGVFLRRLREIKRVDSRNQQSSSESRMDEIEAAIGVIKADLERGQKKEGKSFGGEQGEMPSVNVEDFIEVHKVDTSFRFDVQFCEFQKRKAIDSLALFIYIPFVFLFAYYLVQGKGLGVGFWMNANIQGYILDQEFDVSSSLRFQKFYWDIGGDGEFWEFVEGPLIAGIWPEDNQDGSGYFQISNVAVGALKVRQVRVEADSCPQLQTHLFQNSVEKLVKSYGMEYVTRRLQDFRPYCVDELMPDGSNTDTGPYTVMQRVHDGVGIYSMNSTANYGGWQHELQGYSKLPPMYVERVLLDKDRVNAAHQYVADAYQYRSCAALNGSAAARYVGKFSTYSCDGYGLIVPLSWTGSKVKEAFGLLKNGIEVTYEDPFEHKNVTRNVPWIDQQTRGIIFELVVFNQNVNLMTWAQFVVEVTASGGWIPLKNLVTFRLFNMSDHAGSYYFFLFVFLAYIGGYWVLLVQQVYSGAQELRRGRTDRCAWAKSIVGTLDFWRVFDLVNLVLFAVSIILMLMAWAVGLTEQNVLQTEYYPDHYEDVAWRAQTAAFISATNALLTFFRIFYFLSLQPGLNLLTKTIEAAAKDLFGIVFIFIVVFFAFSLMAFVVYGNTIEDFRTFSDTLASLSRVLIGDFDYDQLRVQQRVFTPFFFCLFNILAVFILLNMVIAILDEAFGKVQEGKYNPAKLLTLMTRDETGTFDATDNQGGVMSVLTQNPISLELKWQWRKFKQWFRLWSGQYQPREKEFLILQERYRNENPRMYWDERLQQIRYCNKGLRFQDKCNLIPRELDDILMERFGQDYQLMENDLIDTPAKAMRRPKAQLLQDIIAFHHVWQHEVSETTQTGQERQEAEAQRRRDREELDKKEFQKRLKQERERSKEDTLLRLRAKYGREPTEDEQLAEMVSVPPDDRTDVERWWMYQLRRFKQMSGLMAQLSKTRNRNFQSTAPKRDFAAKMISNVTSAAARELTDGMLRTVQQEMETKFKERGSDSATFDPVAGFPIDGEPYDAADTTVGDRLLVRTTPAAEPEWVQVVAFVGGVFELQPSRAPWETAAAVPIKVSKADLGKDRWWGKRGQLRRPLRTGDKIRCCRQRRVGDVSPADKGSMWATLASKPDPNDKDGVFTVVTEGAVGPVTYTRAEWAEFARPSVQPLPGGMDGVLKWWRDGRYERLQRDGVLAGYGEEEEEEEGSPDFGITAKIAELQTAMRSHEAPRRQSTADLERRQSTRASWS